MYMTGKHNIPEIILMQAICFPTGAQGEMQCILLFYCLWDVVSQKDSEGNTGCSWSMESDKLNVSLKIWESRLLRALQFLSGWSYAPKLILSLNITLFAFNNAAVKENYFR